jgi:hypothetical protein
MLREPHWTDWKVTSSSDEIDFGTRDYQKHGYLILANEHDHAVDTTLSVEGLPYSATRAVDVFTGETVARFSGQNFDFSVPAHGSAVLVLGDARPLPALADAP